HPLEGPRDDLFRVAQPVDGRRVNPVNAGVQRLVDGRDGVNVVLGTPGEFPAPAADGPSPEADRGNEQVRVSKLSGFHGLPYSVTNECYFSGRSRATNAHLDLSQTQSPCQCAAAPIRTSLMPRKRRVARRIAT